MADGHRCIGRRCCSIQSYEVKHEAGQTIIVSERASGRRNHHRIPSSGRHPYTKHTSLNEPFTVSFLQAHTVTLERDNVASETETGDPSYVFENREDCFDFQTAVRGKRLVQQWETDRIESRASEPHETFREHVKIWQDFISKQHSLSFYANNSSRASGSSQLEFPLVWFQPEVVNRGNSGLRLKFKVPEKKWRFSRRSSSSSSSPRLQSGRE